MKLPRIFSFLKQKDQTSRYKSMADFFLHASDEEQKKLIEKAARESNELQLDLYNRAKQRINV